MTAEAGLVVLSAKPSLGQVVLILKVDGRAHQNQRRIVKGVPGIDINSSGNSFLTTCGATSMNTSLELHLPCLPPYRTFQISNAASITQRNKLGRKVEGRIVLEDSLTDKFMFVLELHFELIFAKNHFEILTLG
jgi:hypothetical protein